MKEKMMEIFTSESLELFLKVQNILRENQIDFSINSKLNNNWSDFFVRVFTFGIGWIGSRGEHRQDYHIFVKELDYERAIESIKNV